MEPPKKIGLIYAILTALALCTNIPFSGCSDDSQPRPIEVIPSRLETLEDAMAIAQSLDTIRNIVLTEISKHNSAGVLYEIDITINGNTSGSVRIVGDSRYSGWGTIWSGQESKHTNLSFSLNDYLTNEGFVVNAEGEITNEYFSEHARYECLESPSGICYRRSERYLFKLLAPALKVKQNRENGVCDTLEFRFSCAYDYLIDKAVVEDSVYTLHYFVKSAGGKIFEW